MRHLPGVSGAILIGAFIAAPAVANDGFTETFPPPKRGFPELLTSKWELCLAAHHLNSFVQNEDGDRDYALRIGIDEAWGERSCVTGFIKDDRERLSLADITAGQASKSDDLASLLKNRESASLENDDVLGESLLARVKPTDVRNGDTQCANFDPDKKTPSFKFVQKNEIRIHEDHRPRLNQGHWYGFDLRMTGAFERCGSRRWVIGQIKQWPSGSSPILAQRFDNGVFHVTIQGAKKKSKAEKSCRCIIAKADGDEGARARRSESAGCDLSHEPVGSWESFKSMGHPTLNGCGFDFEFKRHTADPLPDIDKEWARMGYYIRIPRPADPKRPEDGPDREIVVTLNGENYVSIRGWFGWPKLYEQEADLKIGQYRDNQLGTAHLMVDNIWIRNGDRDGPDAAPDLDPLPKSEN